MSRFLALAFVLAAGPSFAQDATLSKVQGPVFVRAEARTRTSPPRAGKSCSTATR